MLTRASRHKSCLGCIQTKRKCDRTQPRCQRCVARGSECRYIRQGRSPPQRSTHPGESEQSVLAMEELLHDQLPSNWQLQEYHTGPITSFTQCLDDAVFKFPCHPFNLGEMPYENTFDFGSSNIQNNVAVQMPSSTSATDLLITQPTTPDVGLLARVAFVAKRLATIPHRFASEGQTMFIHRAQFQHTFPSSL